MKSRSILTILLALAALLFAHGDGVAGAHNIASFAFSNEKSSAIKVEYGCGWEYPCAPRPSYGRRHYHRPLHDRVEIRNNYGVVNVYVDGHRHYGERPSYRPSCNATSCRPPEEAPPAREESCESSHCDSCGPLCWMSRARAGYCGHGCEWYKETARIESEEQGEYYPRPVYPRPVYHREAPPPRVKRDIPVEAPPAQFAPRRRYEGPPYPAR
jgi:hypothetical protein